MASQAARAVAQEVLETLGRGEKPNVTKIAIGKGYTPKTAASGMVQQTDTYKAEMAPLVTRLETERDAIIARLPKTRGKAKFRDLIDGLDKITKNIQILTGGATDHVKVVTVVKFATHEGA